MKIYTRTGDFGETSLFGGKRVKKCNDVVDLYGLIDELNCTIGVVVSMMESPEVKEFLRDIQRDLFSMGSFFAGSKIDGTLLQKRVKEMEARIDIMDNAMPALRQFILPGGTQLASFVHLTRSVTRRVERKAVFVLTHCSDYSHLNQKYVEQSVTYLNRLSDFLFVLARFINKEENTIEIVWQSKK